MCTSTGLVLLSLCVAHVLLYWTAACLLLPRGVHVASIYAMHKHSAHRVLYNQLVVNLIFLGPIAPWLASSDMGTAWHVASLPAVLVLLEAAFYVAHRAMHAVPWLRRFHAVHHEWHKTLPFSALDCHPVEHVVCNLAPVVLGPVLLRWSLPHAAVLLGVATLNTVWAHRSGAEASHHSRHHLDPRGNYGISATTDRLFGTLLRVDTRE